MSVSSILNSGLQNMQASINRTTIAGSGLNVENSDITRNMVAMRQGAIDARAAASVIKTGDETLGTLINITA